jgi:hypothetical protein
MIIYPIILSPFSATANQVRPKLCINCKFYTKDFFTFSEFGKCSSFPIEKKNDFFLVNGNGNNDNDNKEYEYHYCSTARKFDHMCGQQAKFYEKK